MTEAEALDVARRIKGAFQVTFNNPTGLLVLGHLGEFCGVGESTFDPDPRQDARKQGRYEVWLVIQRMLNLTSEEIYALAAGRPFLRPAQPKETEDE